MVKKYIPFYNVHAAVGRHGANRREDVMLIQFFLTEIARKPPHPITPPTSHLPVDGTVPDEEVLIQWILWFQNCVKNFGERSIVADGRVDPAKTPREWQLHGGGWSTFQPSGTMSHMNITYRKRFRDGHDNLIVADRCPLGLAVALRS